MTDVEGQRGLEAAPVALKVQGKRLRGGENEGDLLEAGKGKPTIHL